MVVVVLETCRAIDKNHKNKPGNRWLPPWKVLASVFTRSPGLYTPTIVRQAERGASDRDGDSIGEPA